MKTTFNKNFFDDKEMKKIAELAKKQADEQREMEKKNKKK